MIVVNAFIKKSVNSNWLYRLI